MRARRRRPRLPVFRGAPGRRRSVRVLSAVGMLPRRAPGVDPRAVSTARPRWRPGRERRPARQPRPCCSRAVHHLAWRSGRTAAVLLPYADALFSSRLWWSQRSPRASEARPRGAVGVTPAAGRRAVDPALPAATVDRRPRRHLVVFVEPRTREGLAAGAPRGRELSIASAAASARSRGRAGGDRAPRSPRRGGRASRSRARHEPALPRRPLYLIRGGGHVLGPARGDRPLRPAGRRARQGPDPRLADGRPPEAVDALGPPPRDAPPRQQESRPERSAPGQGPAAEAACPKGHCRATSGGLPPRAPSRRR